MDSGRVRLLLAVAATASVLALAGCATPDEPGVRMRTVQADISFEDAGSVTTTTVQAGAP